MTVSTAAPSGVRIGYQSGDWVEGGVSFGVKVSMSATQPSRAPATTARARRGLGLVGGLGFVTVRRANARTSLCRGLFG